MRHPKIRGSGFLESTKLTVLRSHSEEKKCEECLEQRTEGPTSSCRRVRYRRDPRQEGPMCEWFRFEFCQQAAPAWQMAEHVWVGQEGLYQRSPRQNSEQGRGLGVRREGVVPQGEESGCRGKRDRQHIPGSKLDQRLREGEGRETAIREH